MPSKRKAPVQSSSKNGIEVGAWPAAHAEMKALSELRPFKGNPRQHSEAHVKQIAASIREWGWTNPIIVDEGGTILAGHGRVLAAYELKFKAVPAIITRGWTKAQQRAYVLADNRLSELSTWDNEAVQRELAALVAEGFDVQLTGFDIEDISRQLAEIGSGGGANGSLADKFMIPPFSVFNAREGWWQDRKRAWIALGIRSEIGREDNVLGMSATVAGIKDPAAKAEWNKKNNERNAGKKRAQQKAKDEKEDMEHRS